jgi:DNA-binding NtrC family response regulator
MLLEGAMKRRILLVDDELPILLTLKAILEMNGFEVETAASVQEAETKLEGGTFHMVITDMRMENETAVMTSSAQRDGSPTILPPASLPPIPHWEATGEVRGPSRCW